MMEADLAHMASMIREKGNKADAQEQEEEECEREAKHDDGNSIDDMVSPRPEITTQQNDVTVNISRKTSTVEVALLNRGMTPESLPCKN